MPDTELARQMSRMARKHQHETARTGQGVTNMRLADFCIVACVREDSTVQSADNREIWPSVEAWQKDRVRRGLAGTLIYNFPAPDKE